MKNRQKRHRRILWILAAALALILCLPAVVSAEPTGGDSADPTTPDTPQYFNVYRVETLDSGLYCYWYDATGVKDAEPQKNKRFIVKFDAGSNTDGTAYSNLKEGGLLYEFKGNGVGQRYKGWLKLGSKKYYYKLGVRQKGTIKIKGIWYQFSKKDGKMIRKIGDSVDKKAQGYRSARKYLIVLKLSERKVRIYKGKKNNWKRYKTFKCTIGAPSTPTPRGTYTIKSRGKYFDTGKTYKLRCWYYTQFYGNYLFHSVIYSRGPSPSHVADGRLGIRASHGCVRLALKNAKWIYSSIPAGTKVVIY